MTEPRILLFTGKGGVGKTSIAAGTAAMAAAAGRRTLVLSTDPAHSLADAFGIDADTRLSEPTLIAVDLHVQQVDAQLRFQQSWADIQRYLLTVLDLAGVDPLTAEELTVIPGAEEVLALLELRLRAAAGDWDVIVVDCAPTAETLRLLALPEVLGWYLSRLLPTERRLARALTPMLTRAAGVPVPGTTVVDAVDRLRDELDDVRRLLAGPRASIRLVLTPKTVVLAEARRSYTALSMFGYRVDGVVANRVFPTSGGDPWRQRWVRAQSELLAEVRESFDPLPVWTSEYRPSEPIGLPALTALAQDLYAGGVLDPLAVAAVPEPFSITRSGATTLLRLALPSVSSDQVDLIRSGDELVVSVGSYRRVLALPSGVARQRVAAARVVAGELQVRFEEGAP